MDNDFKQKLIDIYNHQSERFGKSILDEELQKIIRFGVMGEMGENYFLFIYRDFYRDSGYYGSVIFLNKRDQMDQPVSVIGIEQDGKKQVRNVFVKAALYFLKNELKNTMTLTGKAAVVFEMAKEKINEYLGQSLPKSTGSLLEQFNFDLNNRQIVCTEIKPPKMVKNFESRGLKENLKRLNTRNKNDDWESENVPKKHIGIDEEKNIKKADVGLAICLRCLDLSGEKYLFLQPVILPLKTNGTPDTPTSCKKSDLAEYEWVNTDPGLFDFIRHYTAVENMQGSQKLKMDILNRFFFDSMIEKFLNLPDGYTFYQDSSDDWKLFKELKIFKFKHLQVRFAPSLEKPSAMRYRLRFTSSKGDEIGSVERFETQVINNKTYVLFPDRTGQNWLAVPEDDSLHLHFHPLFDFLSVQSEFNNYDLPEVSAALQELKSEYITIHREPLKKYELEFLPTPILKIFNEKDWLSLETRIQLEFDYLDELEKFAAENPGKEVCTFKRNEVFENRCVALIKDDPFLVRRMDLDKTKGNVCYYFDFREGNFLDWLIKQGKKYLEKGFKIFSTKWKRYIGNAKGNLKVKLNAGIDWLEFQPVLVDSISGKEMEIDFDNSDPGLLDQNIVVDPKGNLHLVTEQDLERLKRLFEFAEYRGGNRFQIPSKNYVLVRKLYDKKMDELPPIKETLALEEKLNEFQHIPEYDLSRNFNGQLRTYQKEGFKWLSFLHEYGFSGCLADDMGLGKTVQTLALLQTLKDNKQLSTSLLVVPVSAVSNWEAEIGRFSKGLTYHRHIGVSRDKDTSAWEVWEKNDLVITSYATLRTDIEIFDNFSFDYVILDESQNIKNAASLVSKAVKVVKGKNRLALSGTPIENNTMELWSLFDFLMPKFLGSAQWFNRRFAQSVEADKNPKNTGLLRKMIYPFILRRKKEEVETELPEKTEIITKLRMEDDQADLYSKKAKYYTDKLEKEIDEKGVSGSSIKILEAMLRLRQVCLFPGILDEKFKDIASAKFNYLKDLLEDILSEDHKVLIFSQFVEVLKIIRSHLDMEKIDYSYIDGSVDVNTRGTMVKRFQEEKETRVFLLSLKAGGVALNLTAADYVIIFDPWWNPAVEAQAVDRSHRIGQTKKVMVYRMVMETTIEEKMLQLQEKKKTLVENLITSDSQAFKNLKKEDILNLFRYK